MFGLDELKERLTITEEWIECPVRGCSMKVTRQHVKFRRDDRFKCNLHGIYISPSTFEYECETDNLLFTDPAELMLFESVKSVKRECRITRDNSEDAVSWNVFRFLERNGLVERYLNSVSSLPIKNAEVIFWSFCRSEGCSWTELNRARRKFGETVSRGSEPDIIIITDKALFFIEAKVTASNETVPSDKKNSKQYLTGGDNWFSRVFTSNYEIIAIYERKYELLRFWLLGTWLAELLNVPFFLLNLVSLDREKEIEAVFKPHIVENTKRKFARITWEEIYSFILRSRGTNSDKDAIIRYFTTKSMGYDHDRNIRKAFLT